MERPIVVGFVAVLAVVAAIILFVVSRRASRRARAAWPIAFFIVVTAILIWQQLSPIMPVTTVTESAAAARILLSLWWLLAAHLVVEVCRAVILAQGGSREARLSSDLIAAIAYIVALLAIMNFVLDLPVRGLLVTSGVIAVIMGLALQTTLADVFSGLAVGIEAPFSVGDWISLDDNLEGRVSQINWRSVHLILDGNDIAIIPNSVIAKAKLINRSVPTPRRIGKSAVYLPTELMPEKAIELLHGAIMLCPGVLQTPAPSVQLGHLGRRLSRYDIVFYVKDTGALGAATDRVLQEIHRQARAAGVGDWGARQGLDRAAVLGIAFFEALPQEVKERLHEVGKPIQLQAGQVLFREGDTGDSLYIVGSGVLEVERDRDGATQHIGRMGPGDYFGEISLLTGAPRGATVTALTASTAFELRSEDLKPILEQEPALATVLEASAQKAMKMLNREVAASTNSALASHGHLIDQIRSFLFQHSSGHGRL
jgi:small-conductance mechanosensitive channel/CRP-like cAMP-binding protein